MGIASQRCRLRISATNIKKQAIAESGTTELFSISSVCLTFTFCRYLSKCMFEQFLRQKQYLMHYFAPQNSTMIRKNGLTLLGTATQCWRLLSLACGDNAVWILLVKTGFFFVIYKCVENKHFSICVLTKQ